MNLPCSLGLGDGLDDPTAAKQKESHPNWHSGGYAHISEKAQNVLLNATLFNKATKTIQKPFHKQMGNSLAILSKCKLLSQEQT
jgi:hypothetical protein